MAVICEEIVMKRLLLIGLMMVVSMVASAQDDSGHIYRETLVCGDEGCTVTCYQPGDRWQSFLQTAGDIELTYFLTTGTRQLKARVADGSITVLDTHPNVQTCKISGVKATEP